MRIVTSTLFIGTLIAFSPTLLVAADGPPALLHNPFSRPASEVIRRVSVVAVNADGSGPNIPLHATMVGSVDSLANVAGRILKPGDEYQGYQLVAIHEQYAIFERDGRSITVYVKPLLAENEEPNERVKR